MLDFLKTPFAGVLVNWNCTLEDFGAEPDHLHLLVSIHPRLEHLRFGE
jgi:putative transposase